NKYNKPQDTQIDKSGDWRVLRGGSWGLDANFVRAAFRYYNFPVSRNYYYGFRVGVVHPPSQ
ncbi:MAG: SUMF1/EgtB/PvdO family nonheme iron enzyme, partial [Anaerolineales bacterium]|nr:SUMF1/EgtB/PvdO family nonheme iron enzyme [Anaerolineales bacterium]